VARIGLAVEIEHVGPGASPWHVIVRALGGLPDNFELQDGPFPPHFEGLQLGDAPMTECRLLSFDTADRFGRPRVDMVGVKLVDPADQQHFAPGQHSALFRP